MGTYLPGSGSLGWAVSCRSVITHSQGIPPNFYLPHVDVGPPSVPWLCASPCCASPHVTASPPLLPIWINVASLNPWLLDFHTVWFSYDSGWYLFYSLVVFFVVVVRGSKVCLSIPLSWVEVHLSFSVNTVFPLHLLVLICEFKQLQVKNTILHSQAWFPNCVFSWSNLWMWRDDGRIKIYMQTFDCVGSATPNPGTVQGSTVVWSKRQLVPCSHDMQ